MPAWLLYSILAIMNLPLMVRYRLTPAHLMLANPSLPWGGMQIGSKTEIMERFRAAPQYLKQLLLPVDAGVDSNVRAAERFMNEQSLAFPIVAKPDQGCVGFGVRAVQSIQELRDVLHRTTVDYMLQEFAHMPQEYGIFFIKQPGSARGSVIGLTQKVIPSVIGDGISTVEQIVKHDPRLATNRDAILTHASGLDRVPNDGEVVELLAQASHTYGAWFYDRTSSITPELESWVNALAAHDQDICHGRFDVRTHNEQALREGRVQVIEFNGCMSEPIHVYDDSHSFFFGIKTFYKAYRDAYRAAQANRGRASVPILRMCFEHRRFFKAKNSVMAQIG